VTEPKTYTQDEYDALVAEKEALKKNRDDTLTEAKRAKKALADYEGIDPAEFKRLKQAADEAEQKRAAAAGDFETLKKQLVENHTKEIGAKDSKIGKLTKALERRLIQAELTKAIAAKKGDPELLLPYAERFARTKETDDDFEAYLVDASGNPRYSDGQATPMSFDAFVEQDLMAKFPRAFDGTGSSGGGATKSAPGGGGTRRIAPGDNAAFLANLDKIVSGDVEVG
jgi:hypothetical protein